MTLCCSEYAFTMCTYTGEGMDWVWRGSCVFAWSGLTWTFSLYELWMFKSYLESKLSQEACISAETEIDWLYLGLRSWFLYWSLQLSSHESSTVDWHWSSPSLIFNILSLTCHNIDHVDHLMLLFLPPHPF